MQDNQLLSQVTNRNSRTNLETCLDCGSTLGNSRAESLKPSDNSTPFRYERPENKNKTVICHPNWSQRHKHKYTHTPCCFRVLNRSPRAFLFCTLLSFIAGFLLSSSSWIGINTLLPKYSLQQGFIYWGGGKLPHLTHQLPPQEFQCLTHLCDHAPHVNAPFF